MTRYLKLGFAPEPGKRAKTMLLEVLKETPSLYIGRKVNRFGDDGSYMDGDGTMVESIQMIDKSLVTKTKDMRMDTKYCELVNA